MKKGIPNINRNVNTQYTSTYVKEISYKQALLRTQKGFDCWKYTAGKNQANLAFPASKGLLRVRYSKEINKKLSNISQVMRVQKKDSVIPVLKVKGDVLQIIVHWLEVRKDKGHFVQCP